MNKDQVLESLKSIKYPGFSRDIVSFGMVKNIVISNNEISISLNITSQNNEKKQLVSDNVKNLLTPHFGNVKILITEESHQNQAASVSGSPSIIENITDIIAIASGKGGVGKSTIAANLACALTRKGKKVGLLDLDIYGPSLPIVLGIQEQPKMTQNKKLIPLEKFGMKVMSFGFISGNDTPVIWRGPLVARMTEQFFRDVEWGDLDVLILDLPPGTGDIQLTLTQKLQMTGAVMVTTPQDIALADVRKGSDMFRKVNTPVLGIIENMSGLMLDGMVDNTDINLKINNEEIKINKDGSFKMNIDLFKMGGGEQESERLGVPMLGHIPLSKKIMISTDLGVPLTVADPITTIGKIYLDIADKLINSIK
tara:strand:+ start:1176 stop:2276 length:1101 start_codon:yes stop_codon:yes gene_type:complete